MKSNFIQRTITGVLFVAVLVGCILYSPLTFGILFALISALSVHEFGHIVNQSGVVSINKNITSLGGAYLFLALMSYSTYATDARVFLPYLVLLLYLMITELYLKKENPMAVGPYVGLQVQSNMSSQASFLTIFAITVVALICVLCCRIQYPKVQRKKFSIKDTIHAPALPFMFNMMFLMIPYGAVIAYSSILAQEKGLLSYLPYFYICLVIGMLVSKLSAQKMLDAGNHRILVYLSLVIPVVTMVSYIALSTGIHLLIAGFFFGVGYGILQPLFQSFVTGTTPAPKRGVANATYMLSYDIGIGSLLMGCLQESIGLPKGFALTAIAYVIGGVVYATYVDRYYREQKTRYLQSVSQSR